MVCVTALLQIVIHSYFCSCDLTAKSVSCLRIYDEVGISETFFWIYLFCFCLFLQMSFLTDNPSDPYPEHEVMAARILLMHTVENSRFWKQIKTKYGISQSNTITDSRQDDTENTWIPQRIPPSWSLPVTLATKPGTGGFYHHLLAQQSIDHLLIAWHLSLQLSRKSFVLSKIRIIPYVIE